jgi:hypothetical protein
MTRLGSDPKRLISPTNSARIEAKRLCRAAPGLWRLNREARHQSVSKGRPGTCWFAEFQSYPVLIPVYGPGVTWLRSPTAVGNGCVMM